MARIKQRQTSFASQLRLALEHLHDPEWLHLNSPLAAPYFLGPRQPNGASELDLDADHDDAAPHNGRHLQQVLRESLRSLWSGSLPKSVEQLVAQARLGRDGAAARSKYDYLLLDSRYFHNFFEPQPSSKIWEELLHVSKPSFYRHLEAAEMQLGTLLLHKVHPSVRLEQAPKPEFVIERTGIIEEALTALQENKAVCLEGESGVGKTVAASEICRRWSSELVFWYSFRPSFNDSLISFVFALGNFLRRHGASTLWRQLIADRGKIDDAQLALGLAQNDFNELRIEQPLLCLDEVNSIVEDKLSTANADHQQIRDFVARLASSIPTLLVGGSVPVKDLHPLRVGAFSLAETKDFASHIDHSLTGDDLVYLHDYTGGKASLLRLSMTGFKRGDRSDELAERLPTEAALPPLLDNVFGQIDQEKQQILQMVSVFRSAAPADIWTGVDAVDELITSGLVQPDSDGSLNLTPSVKELIYRNSSVEGREALHAAASTVCDERGESTEAAYHLVAGGEPAEAINLWFPVREQELRLGQAHNARAIFRNISLNRLPPESAEKLAIIRAELNEMVGDGSSVVQDLQAVSWLPQSPLQISAERMLGDALSDHGQESEALDRYEVGIETASRLIEEKVRLHTAKGRLLLDLHDHQKAQAEATRAQYEVEWLQGALADRGGDYRAARRHHRIALTLAEELDDERLAARAHVRLGILAGRQADEDASFDHFNRAVEQYEQLGDLAEVAKTWNNIAAARIQVRQFNEAIPPAERAQKFAERTDNVPLLADSLCNLAEAHCELADYPRAIRYATRTLELQSKDNHPYALFTLGNALFETGETGDAVEKMLSAVEHSRANQDPYILAYALRALAQMHESSGAAELAKLTHGQADELFASLGLVEETFEAVNDAG